jgi:4-alpha-glucanotransferase
MMEINLKENIRSKRRAGVSFPLSSLFSEKSYGIGDFYTLQKIGEWAGNSGISLLQILPLNDLGFGRSPYSSISAFAIDPVYISLYLLSMESFDSNLKSHTEDKNIIKQKKISILREIYQIKYNESLIKELDSFLMKHKWLDEYIAFTLLNNEYKGVHWSLWQKEFSKDLVVSLKNKDINEYYFIAWMQYVAYQQLKDQKNKLEKLGVYLKGDMPILTSDHSADVWARSSLFNRELTSGAPPDYFNADGQNWGFPVIDWHAMKRDHFSWWKERLTYLENFYHLYRIDHVLGMYRIWAIPKDKESAKFGFFHPQKGTSRKEFNHARLFPEDFEKLGLIYEFKPEHYIFYWDFFKTPNYQSLPEEIKARFYPLSNLHLVKDELHWKKAGEEILKYLFENSSMLACAEDLGAVPSFVRDSIFELQLLGLDIIRWTRSFEDGSYIQPEGYRKNAVSALSVHDTSTALGWWEEASEDDRKAFQKLFEEDTKPSSKEIKSEVYKKDEISKLLLDVAFRSASLFSIHMLQDYILSGEMGQDRKGFSGILTSPLDHRINVPGTPEEKNWGYVFPFLIEELLEDKGLSQKIKELVLKNGRLT